MIVKKKKGRQLVKSEEIRDTMGMTVDEQTRIKNSWKPAKFISYETMGLTQTKLN